MNRRTFLKALGATGLVAVAPKIILPDEPEVRRFWALNSSHIAPEYLQTLTLPWFDSSEVRIRHVRAVTVKDGQSIVAHFEAPESGIGLVKDQRSGLAAQFDNGRISIKVPELGILYSVKTSYANCPLIGPDTPIYWPVPAFDHAAIWTKGDMLPESGELPLFDGMRGWRSA